ncbi:MAG: hypothetical protein D6698_07460 [Gammaproteobacteria bacterium]|nr:MAG: hypothetical protein D6698_07460 [Gammaproteobacteria bacterium]
MPLEHGKPIRSDELKARFDSVEEQAEVVVSKLERAYRNLTAVELALLAAARSATPTFSYQNGKLVYSLPASPLNGSEMEGRYVISRRTERSLSIPYEVWPEGSGEVDLFVPGRIWARLSPNQEETFEARILPGYLTEYNEIYIPILSGQITLTTHDSTGSGKSFEALTESFMWRSDSFVSFNGHISITSRSNVGFQGLFIHTLGGITFNRSNWESTFDAQASVSLPEGSYQINSVTARGKSLPFTVYKNNVVQDPQLIIVLQGDVLRFEVSGINGLNPIRYLKVEMTPL